MRSTSSMKLIALVVTLYHLLLVTEAVPLADGCATQPCKRNEIDIRGKTVCDPVWKYTIEWFIENATERPEPTSCLFYTRGLSKTARHYAKSRPMNEPPMTTIWDVWPKEYYSKRITGTNPLRCIMQDKHSQTQYYTSMSMAFASLCDVFATVMDSNIGPGLAFPDDVNKNGLWFNAEFPTLQKLNKVSMIEAISPDGGKRIRYWTSRNIFATSIDDEDVLDDLDTDAQHGDWGWDRSTDDDLYLEEWDTNA